MRAAQQRRVPPAVPSRAVMASAAGFTAAAWGVIGLTLWPIYRDPAFIVLVIVALVVGVGAALAGAIFRWPLWGMIAAGCAAFVVLGVPLAVPGRTVYGVLPEPEGIIDLVAGIGLGWRQLVTIDLPVGSYQALLVPALVLVLFGSLITMGVALRARHPELAALIPLASFTLAVALGPQEPEMPAVTSIALLVILLLWQVVWRRHRGATGVHVDTASSTVRAVASATVLLLLAGSVGAALALTVATPSDRSVIRTVVSPPFQPLDHPSPLAAYRASFDPAVATEVALVVAGMPVGSRVRLATLDSYDGTVFAVGSDRLDSASGSFVRIPTRRDLGDLTGTRVTVDVEVRRSTGLWLPTVGDLESVSFIGDDVSALRDRLAVNTTTGTAVLVGGVPAGLSYTISAVSPPDLPFEPDALAPAAVGVPAITAVPDALRTWLDGVVVGVEGDGDRLFRALTTLRAEGYLSHGVGADKAPSRSGHSLARMEELFSVKPMVGDAEQFATAAALIARELGYASRVVLGFGPVSTVGVLELRESDRTAWVEVATPAGWVSVDVVPERREVPPTAPEDAVSGARPQNPAEPPADDPAAPEEFAPPEVEQRADDARDPLGELVRAVVLAVGVTALVLGLIAAPFVGVAVVKARRRHRRRTARDPARRILGGWYEITDAARDFWIDIPGAATRSEAARVIGRPATIVIARAADRAVYAPDPPSEQEADQVWAAADAVRASLAADRDRRQRWRAAVSVRSLRRYSDRERRTEGSGP